MGEYRRVMKGRIMVNKRIRVIAVLLATGIMLGTGADNFISKAAKVETQDAEVIAIVEEEVPLVEDTGESGLPSKVDNSQTVYFPPIIEQGTYNSCSSWAMTYYQTSYEFNRAEDKDGSNPANQLSPVFTYNLTNNGKNEGTYFTDVAKVLKEVGTVSMEELPADTTNGDMPIGDISASSDTWRSAHKRRISDYVAVSDGDADRMSNSTPITSAKDEDLNEMKQALADGYILTASTPGNKWKYMNIEANPNVPGNNPYVGEQVMYLCDREGYHGHRITVVGYNDDIWVDINHNGNIEEGEFGAFKIANSRGTEYGNQGYMWVAYDTLNIISSCYEGSAIDLGFEHREPSLIDVGYVKVDVNKAVSPYTVEFDATTDSAEALSMVVTATEKKGNRNLYVYNVAPFGKSVEIGLGDVAFDGSNSVITGSFSVALDNLFADIATKDMESYDWYVKVSNLSSDSKVVYSGLRIVDQNQNVIYAATESDVVMERGEKFVKLEKVS